MNLHIHRRTFAACLMVFITAGVAIGVGAQDYQDYVSVRDVLRSEIIYRQYKVRTQDQRMPLQGVIIQDLAAAKELLKPTLWLPTTSLRLKLLEEGIAYISDENLVVEAERRAQDAAAAKHIGIWKDAIFLERHGYTTTARALREQNEAAQRERDRQQREAEERRLLEELEKKRLEMLSLQEEERARDAAKPLNRVLSFFGKYWLASLGLAGSLASLFAYIRFSKRFLIVLVGASGVGKSAFRERLLLNMSVLKMGEPESTRGEVVSEEEFRSRDGRHRFKLQICDSGGQYAGKLFDRLSKGGRERVVLVVVYTPYNVGAQGAAAREIDSDIIQRQLGWTESLITGYLTSAVGKRRCYGVLTFINMFDLFSPSNDDSAKKVAFRDIFEAHIQRLAATRVPTQTIVGSCLLGWHTLEARTWVFRKVTGEATGS